MRVDLPASKYPVAADRRAFVAALEPRLAAIPGVQAATITTGVPSRDGGERYFEIEGTPGDAPRVMVSTVTITPSFFDTIDVRMRAGPRLRGRRWRTGIRNRDHQPPARRAVLPRIRIRSAGACASRRGNRRPATAGRVADHRRRRAGCQPRIAVGQLPQRRCLPAVPRGGAASASLLLRSGLAPASIMNAARREVQDAGSGSADRGAADGRRHPRRRSLGVSHVRHACSPPLPSLPCCCRRRRCMRSSRIRWRNARRSSASASPSARTVTRSCGSCSAAA